MADLPIYLNTEVGYALWWLTHPERGTSTGPEILDRLVARGHVADRNQARAVLRQARANVTATGRAQNATGASSLSAACGYSCPATTPIALRIRMNVTDATGNIVESRSIVINARASDNLQYVLQRAREAFNSRFRAGTAHRSGQLSIDRDLTPEDIDQVLLNYTEGSVWA